MKSVFLKVYLSHSVSYNHRFRSTCFMSEKCVSQVLDSLKTQALTSSGSSGFGNDGSTSTGVARKLVKERFAHLFLCER